VRGPGERQAAADAVCQQHAVAGARAPFHADPGWAGPARSRVHSAPGAALCDPRADSRDADARPGAPPRRRKGLWQARCASAFTSSGGTLRTVVRSGGRCLLPGVAEAGAAPPVRTRRLYLKHDEVTLLEHRSNTRVAHRNHCSVESRVLRLPRTSRRKEKKREKKRGQEPFSFLFFPALRAREVYRIPPRRDEADARGPQRRRIGGGVARPGTPGILPARAGPVSARRLTRHRSTRHASHSAVIIHTRGPAPLPGASSQRTSATPALARSRLIRLLPSSQPANRPRSGMWPTSPTASPPSSRRKRASRFRRPPGARALHSCSSPPTS